MMDLLAKAIIGTLATAFAVSMIMLIAALAVALAQDIRRSRRHRNWITQHQRRQK